MNNKWKGVDAKGNVWTNEQLIHKLGECGEIWLERPDYSSHGLFEKDAVPRTCPECGFPILQIISKIYSWREFSLGCPWCSSSFELCLICGKLSYTLPDSCNKHKERMALRGIPE
jgi:hypothetical protein